MSRLEPASLALAIALAGCGAGERRGTTDTADDADATQGASEGDEGAEDGGELLGRCRPTCEEPVDCCAPGTPDCPGDYPNAWSCDAGFCVAGGCVEDENCTLGAQTSDFECHPIEGMGRCFIPCEDQGGCASVPGSSCVGVADDGAQFCQMLCTSDVDCQGAGVCAPDGQCRCAGDGECSADGLRCQL